LTITNSFFYIDDRSINSSVGKRIEKFLRGQKSCSLHRARFYYEAVRAGAISFVFKKFIFPEQDNGMKQYACQLTFSTLLVSFTLTLIAFFPISSNAQKRKLNPALFRNYVKPNSNVDVKTVADQKVRETTTTTSNNIVVPDKGKSVILYQDRVTKIDMVSLKKYDSVTEGKLPDKDVKVIPELHVEAATGNGGTLTYRILFTMKQPLSYDASSNSFKGKIGFLLMSDSDNTVPVKEPVKIEVRSDKTKSIVPDKVAIDHLSIESTDVDLVADNVADSISVSVSTVSHPEGYVTFLQVEPALEISTNRKELQGFGIEETDIDVKLKGSTSADSVKVVFSAEKGTITPGSINVKFRDPAIVTLRSQGLGNSKITASASSLNSSSLVFMFNFPWAFLLASLIGGLLGGFVKFLSSDKKKKFLQKIVIGGVLTGLIVAAAYYGLGISVIGIKISAFVNEIAVFALSALGAIVGIRLPKPAVSE